MALKLVNIRSGAPIVVAVIGCVVWNWTAAADDADEEFVTPITEGKQWFSLPDRQPLQTARFGNIDPEGTAEVTVREGAAINIKPHERLMLQEGYCVALATKMQGSTVKDAWVFLMRIEEVTSKTRAKVRVSKETAETLDVDLHVKLFYPIGSPAKGVKSFPSKPAQIYLPEVLSPREEGTPSEKLPPGVYFRVGKNSDGDPEVNIVKLLAASKAKPARSPGETADVAAKEPAKKDSGEVPFPELPAGAGKIDKNASKKFKSTPSGLKYRILRKGDGRKTNTKDSVKLHQYAWTDSGTIVWDTYKDEKPYGIALGNPVPAGWLEGVQMVPIGGMIELLIPAELAKGGLRGLGGVPPDEPLHVVVEMIWAQKILR